MRFVCLDFQHAVWASYFWCSCSSAKSHFCGSSTVTPLSFLSCDFNTAQLATVAIVLFSHRESAAVDKAVLVRIMFGAAVNVF